MKYNIVILFVIVLSLKAEAQVNEKAKYFSLDGYTGAAHDLAMATERQQMGRILKLIKVDTSLANVREPTHGITLLQYSVFTGRYNSSEALLQGGANPNLRDNKDGRSPMHEAANKHHTSKFLQLLLTHGGNPNLETKPANHETFTTTPLIEAASIRLESVKLLLNAGANIDYVTQTGHYSAIGAALTSGNLLTAQYLLFEKKADYTVACGETVDGRILYISNVLRNITPKIGSAEWQQKQQIVKFLEEKGVNYKLAPIPYRVRHSFGQGYIDSY